MCSILFSIILNVCIIIFSNNPQKISEHNKTSKKCFLKTTYFLFLKTENRKQFLVIKQVFQVFCFGEQKTILKNCCQIRL